MSNVALYEALTGTGEFFARFLGRRSAADGEKFQGKFGSPEFFNAARRGDPKAMRTLKSKGYGHVWNIQGAQPSIEREIARNARRTGMSRMTPRGLLTGSPMYGLDRARSNFNKGALKMSIGLGSLVGIASMATAPKGKMVQRGVENIGMTAGGIVGAAAGAALLGLPGEIAGGFIGGTVGEKVGALISPLEELGREARHSNFGGNYKDSEEAFTMRARAVAEIGSSALNARRYLGSEAALMHQ